MVPHDAVRKNSHRQTTVDFGYHREEGAKVLRLVKQRLTMVATVENVLHKAVWRNATMPGHGLSVINPRAD